MHTEALTAARKRAEKEIDNATAALKAAAAEIAENIDIPHNIKGLTPAELLGRMSYIPSMHRDLKQACLAEITGRYISEILGDAKAVTVNPVNNLTHAQKAQKVTEKPLTGTPAGVDVHDLHLTEHVRDSLIRHKINNIDDIGKIPDEHLLKIPGFGPATVQAIRSAVVKAVK